MECMLFSSALLSVAMNDSSARLLRHLAEQLGVHGEVLALVDGLAEQVRAGLHVDVVAVADLHRVDAHALLLGEVRRILGRDDALVGVAVGEEDHRLAAGIAVPHASHGGAHRIADGGLRAVDDAELDAGDQGGDERVVERRRREDEGLACAKTTTPMRSVLRRRTKSMSTSLATSRRVARWRGPRPLGEGTRSLFGESMTACIEPDRSSTRMMSMPFSSSVSPWSTLWGRPRASTAITSAAPRSMPGMSRSDVRQPRGPTTSGRMVGSPSRGTRASAPRVARHTTYGTLSSAITSAAHQPARASQESESAVEGCEPSGPGHVVHCAERHASPRASTGPTSATARMARVPSTTSDPADGSRLHARASGADGAVDCAGADVGGMVARTTRSASTSARSHSVSVGVMSANLTEIALLEERRQLGQRKAEVRRAAQRPQRLVGRRLEPVEPEARAEVLAHGVVDAIEELGEPLRLEQPGVARLVEALEGDLPRRTRRRRGRQGTGTLEPPVHEPGREPAEQRPRSRPTPDRARAPPTPRAAGGAAGFGLGCASGVDAVGSSTTIVCGFVQSVTTSLFARAIDTGSGGSTSVCLPGSLGKATSGRSSVVCRRAALGVCVEARQARARAPVLIRKGEARRLQRFGRVAVALQLEPARKDGFALAVRNDDVQRRSRSRSSRARGRRRPSAADRRLRGRSRRTRPAPGPARARRQRTPRTKSQRVHRRILLARRANRSRSGPDERAARLDLDGVEPQLVEGGAARLVRSCAWRRRTRRAPAGRPCRPRPTVRSRGPRKWRAPRRAAHYRVGREHHGHDVVLGRGERQRALVARVVEVAHDEGDAAAARSAHERLERRACRLVAAPSTGL